MNSAVAFTLKMLMHIHDVVYNTTIHKHQTLTLAQTENAHALAEEKDRKGHPCTCVHIQHMLMRTSAQDT